MKRVLETRDFASARDLYLKDFMKRQIDTDARVYLYKSPFGSFGIDFLPWSQISDQDWERLYFAYMNLEYLRTISAVVNFSPSNIKTNTKNHFYEYPPEVASLLFRETKVMRVYAYNEKFEDIPAYSAKRIDKHEDLLYFMSTLEKAGEMMRELLRKSPREKWQFYEEILRRCPVGQKQYFAGDFVYVAPESRYGFPKGTRFFHLSTKPQFFDITLVKSDEGMKIVWARVSFSI